MYLSKVAAAGLLMVSLSACASSRDRLVRQAAPCADQQVQIYFEPDSWELTPEGRAVIGQAAAEARACRVEAVEVLGLADAAGAADANFELSAKRAQSVTEALSAAGLPNADFRMAAAGDVGAVAVDGTPRPLRRRADIILHLARP